MTHKTGPLNEQEGNDQKREIDKDGHWICPHGFVTGFFPVPGKPHLIEHRSCGICCAGLK